MNPEPLEVVPGLLATDTLKSAGLLTKVLLVPVTASGGLFPDAGVVIAP